MTYAEMGAAAERLLAQAKRLSRGDRDIGLDMLLLAAASLVRERATFVGAAGHAFDELYEEGTQH